ncbi:hypothetical protein FJTKL_02525 [Diaporthe vaccinii]|uniref:Uncharacterized protein n=1 Tax=Diaporthe vaccinii TaxID=105482 RepID=A0ABR4DY21_9PEZI
MSSVFNLTLVDAYKEECGKNVITIGNQSMKQGRNCPSQLAPLRRLADTCSTAATMSLVTAAMSEPWRVWTRS